MAYEPNNLTNAEQAVLIATYRVHGDSLKTRSQRETIKRYLPKNLDDRTLKRINKAFKSLVAKNLLIKHPSGKDTYQFSREGQILAQFLDST